MQGLSQSIQEEIKATVAIPGFGQGLTPNASKGQEETPMPHAAQAYSDEGPGIKILAAKCLGLICACVRVSEESNSRQER